MRHSRALAVVGLCGIVNVMCGCAASHAYRHETYVVRPQDTLYSIAWRHDVDFRELAKWNHIPSDYRLVVGQVLVLQPERALAPHTAASAPVTFGAPAASVTPTTPATPVAPAPAGAPRSPIAPRVGKPLPPDTSAAAAAAAAPVATPTWSWPTERASPPRPVPGGGILLFGRLGQDVRAARSGRVVYTGSGIRGYGNLIIVKHGDNLLSSYAHNREMLVHEGQDVGEGQVIAHMGTAAHQISALYFEIRLNGKPVDPLQYLPAK